MDMQITIKFPVSLVNNQPTALARNYPPGTRVRQVIDDFDLPAGQIGVILFNGQYADHGTLLSDGGILTLLPLVDGG
jgi:hypothetical protein